jgi:hypothetical protein
MDGIFTTCTAQFQKKNPNVNVGLSPTFHHIFTSSKNREKIKTFWVLRVKNFDRD